MLAKRQQNYADKARLLTITTVRFGGAGVLGQLIPPNLSFIFYGVLSTESVGLLFMSGVIPGLLMVLIFLTYIVIRCSMNPRLGPTLPVMERVSWKEKFVSLRGVFLLVALILLILGIIYTGIATPHRGSWCGGCGSDDLHCHQAKAQLGDPKAGHFFIWFSVLKPPSRLRTATTNTISEIAKPIKLTIVAIVFITGFS